MKNSHLSLIALLMLAVGLSLPIPLIWVTGTLALTYSIVAYIVCGVRNTYPKIWAEIVEVKDGGFSHFLVKIHITSSHMYFSRYINAWDEYRINVWDEYRKKYYKKERAEEAANEYILKHLNPEGKKRIIVSTIDPQNQVPVLELPPTAEALADFVNKMSDQEYENFSNLLEKSENYTLRPLPSIREKDFV